MRYFKQGLAAGLLISLAGCGGGGSGAGPVTVFTYQTIDSAVPGDSNLRAVGFDRDAGGVVTDTANLQGTLTRDTQAINIAGLIVDADGQTANTWSDGTTTVGPSAVPAFTGIYDFFVPVTVTRNGLSDVYLIGVASRHEDLPSTGGATFSGQSSVGGILTGGGSGATSFDATGDLTLTADFAGGLVDVVMDGLTGAGVPFDQVEIQDMAIVNGAGDAIFQSNGSSTIAMTNGGTGVTPAGVLTGFDATGSFFGGDATGPQEAGGVFYADGPDGQIYGVFVADQRN